MKWDNGVSWQKPSKDWGDLHILAMDCHCLNCISWLKLIYSVMAMKWLSIGSRFGYVRPYECDCKFIHEELNTAFTKIGGWCCHIFYTLGSH